MSTNDDCKPASPARRTLNLPSPPESPIDRIASLYGGDDLARNVAAVLDRYLVMLHRAIPKFSDRELCVVIDALGDSWDPTPGNIAQIPREVLSAIITDRLDVKWGIDTDRFGPRLDRTTFYERVTLGEITAAYWRRATTDSAPQDIINEIKKLLRPASSCITPTSRPRRMSAHLFEQASSSAGQRRTTGADDPDADSADGDGNSDPNSDADTGADNISDGNSEEHDIASDRGEEDTGADDISEAAAPDITSADDVTDAATPDDGADPDSNEPASTDSPQDPLQ